MILEIVLPVKVALLFTLFKCNILYNLIKLFLMAKDYLPKIGDTFYFKDSYGELQERTCVDILKGEGDIQTIYYTYKDKRSGLFVTESAILNPNSKQVKKLLAIREKKAWKEFWNDRRLEEFCNIFNDLFSKHEKDVLKEYINSKIK